jgi:hypothetical protein
MEVQAMNIRLPVERHKRLRRVAFELDMTMNDIINDALEAHLPQLEATMSTRAYPPTHPFAGSDSERQSVGDPGHCEDCAEFGHVAAHPDLGCGDVGCNRTHAPGEPSDIRGMQAMAARRVPQSAKDGDDE